MSFKRYRDKTILSFLLCLWRGQVVCPTSVLAGILSVGGQGLDLGDGRLTVLVVVMAGRVPLLPSLPEQEAE